MVAIEIDGFDRFLSGGIIGGLVSMAFDPRIGVGMSAACLAAIVARNTLYADIAEKDGGSGE